MGLFDSAWRAVRPARWIPDQELEDEREKFRLRYVSTSDSGKADRLRGVLDYYDEEMTRRANKAYERENPNPPGTRHREHGWYLPNDD